MAGRFRITRQLGRGGMGSVWAAVHETLGREVAVKFLQPLKPSRVLAERFVSEAHIVAAIKHRFVVDVFDFGVTEDGLHYMVLELLHGRSLADRMDYGPALGVRQAVQLMADCLRGLHVVHEAGIVHRDLKPDNIFVIEDADGAFPKLIDFGISRRTEPSLQLDADRRTSRLTQPGTVVGTPQYMSPEQLRGRHIDRRSDVYGIGVILYELLVGRLPFRQDNVGDLMVAITVDGAPSLRDSRPELGEQLARVIQRALDPVRERRYATALELREELINTLPSLPESALCVLQSPGSLASECSTGAATEQLLPKLVSDTRPVAPSAQPPRRLHARLLLALASVSALAWMGWTIVHALARSQLSETASGSVTALPPLDLATPSAQPTVPPAPAPAHEPAHEVAPAAPTPARAGADHAEAAAAASKPVRARASAREASPRPAPANRVPKLYRKLDF